MCICTSEYLLAYIIQKFPNYYISGISFFSNSEIHISKISVISVIPEIW